jgi:HD-GYP domain-containing protein (c-di-GMP phosphodiesterase class II)
MILLALEDVRPGMVLGVGLRNREGNTVLGAGQTLTPGFLERLKGLGYCAVWIDDEDTRDIPFEDALSDETRTSTTRAIQDTFTFTLRQAQNLGTISVQEVRGTLEDRRFQQGFKDLELVERLTGTVEMVVEEVLDRTVLTGLGSLRTYSTYLYHHSLDVAVTATMLGRILGYDRKMLSQLAVGCILHDIGTLFVDPEVLNKPALLTEDEFRRVIDHTSLGYLFIRDSLRVGLVAAHIAYQHHERQNGSGYPRGLVGSNRLVTGAEMHLPGRITPLAEIAAIADFHDACSSDRPHRARLATDQVWRTMRDAAGTHLNREMVEAFLRVLPPYPVGTQVQLLDGPWRDHLAVVVRVASEAMHRPLVRVLSRPDGERIDPVDIDLRREDTPIRGRVRGAPQAPAVTPVPIVSESRT